MAGRKEKQAMLTMLLCSCLWSIGGIFIKVLDMNSMVIAGFRSLIAAMTVVVYMFVLKQRLVINRNVLLSTVSLAATFICFCTANKLTTSANAIVLQFSAPVFIMIISGIFLKTRFRPIDIAAVTLTVSGIAMVVLDGLGTGRTIGNIVGIMSGFTMGCMFVFVGETPKDEKMSGILLGHLLTAIIGIPFAFFTQNTFNAKSIGVLFILGVVQLGIPYRLLGIASNNCPAFACALISATEPLLNPVWVWIFDGEHPTALAFVGSAVVIVSVTLWCVLKDSPILSRRKSV